MKDVNDVIKENERLVTYVLKKYFPQELGNEDMHQIGRIGLWEATLKYDEDKGTKFETFAISCIKLKIARELQKYSYQMRAEDRRLIYEDEKLELAELLKDVNVVTPEDGIIIKEIFEEFDEVERKIINLKSSRKTNEEIAESLKTSLSTVKRKTRRIKNKLNEVI